LFVIDIDQVVDRRRELATLILEHALCDRRSAYVSRDLSPIPKKTIRKLLDLFWLKRNRRGCPLKTNPLGNLDTMPSQPSQLNISRR
jgi:hypothetical protein